MSATTAMPQWLLDKLENEGVLDGRTRLTRHAKPRRCTRCGIYVLAGLEDCIAGRPLFVELLPTTSAGELFALLVGRRSYGLIGDGLHLRDELHITTRPADTNRVHVDHDCTGPPLPVNARYVPRPTPATTDQPPY